MDELNKGHLDSVLTYVAGKSNPLTEPLRERGVNWFLIQMVEASSWLLMATDLVPFSPNPMSSAPQLDLEGNLLNFF